MNKRDRSDNFRGPFRGQVKHNRHNNTGPHYKPDQQFSTDPKYSAQPYYDQSWISNQKSQTLFSRSGHPKPLPGNNYNWNKREPAFPKVQSYVAHGFDPQYMTPAPPPPRISASPPPKSTSPFPGSEEYLQKKIQLQSGSLLKQMEESPNSELVLPRQAEPVDDSNENFLPGMQHVRAVAESNSVELSNSRRRERRAAQLQQNPEVKELVKRIRLLRQQERAKVRRELQKVHSKTLNFEDCETIHTIMPDLTIKMEEMPEEFISIFSDACTIDLDSSGVDEVEPSFCLAENIVADGSLPYNPFEVDFDCDNSVSLPSVQGLSNNHQTVVGQECQVKTEVEPNSHFNTTEKEAPQEFTRRVTFKCKVKAGRAETQGKTKFTLRRDPIDLTGEDSQSSMSPPPRISNEVPTDPKLPHSEKSIGLVIPDQKDTFSKNKVEDVNSKTNVEEVGITHYKSDENANGYHAEIEEDMEFRRNFNIDDDEDEWNRQITVKRKTVDDKKVPDSVDVGKDNTIQEKSDTGTPQVPEMQNGQIIAKMDKETTPTIPEEEELDYEAESDEDEGMTEGVPDESQPEDNCIFQGQGSEEISLDTPKIENASTSDEMDADGEIEEGPQILVLDPTSRPGKIVLNRGKLINVQMICQTSSAGAEEKIMKDNDKVTQTTNTEISKGDDDDCSKSQVDVEPPSKRIKKSKEEVSSTKNIETQKEVAKKVSMKRPRRPEREEVKRMNRRIQTDPDTTSLGKLRDKFNRYKRKTRAAIKKLRDIDKKLEELFTKHRDAFKSLESFVSISDSEEELPEKDDSPKEDAAKAAKYFYIPVDGSAPSERNPILSSDSPSEQVLTQVVPDDAENNPVSPPDLGQTLGNMDLFSIIAENKTTFTEAAGPPDMEIVDENFTETSNTMPESEAAECENTDELGGMMSIAETVPADILESSDNENLADSPPKNPVVKLIKYNEEELNRLRSDISSKTNEQPQTNNNVKEELLTSFDTSDCLETDIYMENEADEQIIDYVGWIDAILAITVVKNLVVAGNEKGKLFYYDTRSNYPIFSEALTTLAITSIVAQGKKTRLYIGSLDSSLVTYDLEGRREIERIMVDVPIQCMEVSWNKLFIGTSCGDLVKCTLPKLKVSLSVNVMQEAVLAIRCGLEGSRRIVVVAMRNGPIYIRDANSFLQLRILGSVSCATVYSLVLHNNRVYCGTSQQNVLAFNFHDGQFMFDYSESNGSGIVCMTTMKNLLFVACYNGSIYVYNTKDNSFITSILAPAGMLLSMAVVNKKLIVGTKQNFQCLPLPASIKRLL